MNIERELGRYSPERETALTIGVFDGVHRGHRHLISRLTAEAKRTGLLAGVLTFRNHPASVLRPDFRPRYLTSFQERLGLIEERGVDFIVPVTFDLELSKVGARRFAEQIKEQLRMKALVVGPDFAMGRGREGDTSMLTALGEQMGFYVHVVEPLGDSAGEIVRSTSVRDALSRGDVDLVAELLGRTFALTGTVVKGHGRGGPMGFPTANLRVPEGLALPSDGIYATWAHVAGRRYMAATSIGERLTFEDREHTVEAFILDFEEDLYQQDVRLDFVRRLRDEVKFDSIEALQRQVEADVAETSAILRSEQPVSEADGHR